MIIYIIFLFKISIFVLNGLIKKILFLPKCLFPNELEEFKLFLFIFDLDLFILLFELFNVTGL